MMTTTKEPEYGTRLQIWPGGHGLEYFGDLDGPAKQRKLRNVNYNGGDREKWRAGTAEEWRQLKIETLAEMYAERDILCCDSMLVDDLIKQAYDSRGDLAEAFQQEEINGLYKDPSDWTLEECRDYLSDYRAEPSNALNPWAMSREDIIAELEAVSIECRADESNETLIEALVANINDETIPGLDDWREAAREHAQENPAEVYEWWRVSDWLCRQLAQHGEVTIDNGYGHWWGRCCTGQGLIMDGVLQRIAASFVPEVSDASR